MHRLVAEWVADGSVDGLRVDHVDGLADPGAYLRRLRALAPTQWIGVEKILGEGEVLPPWPVDGTTGYETGALLTRLLTAAEGEGPLTALYHRFAGALDNFDEVEEDARHEILEHWLAGDAKRVALALHRMCQDDLDLRDYSLRDASILIRELVAGAPRLPDLRRRPKAPPTPTSPASPRSASACGRAGPTCPSRSIDLVARLFATGGDGPNGLEFVRRFQQLSTATAAKAVEDTAAYRDVRYIALNEVGCDPRRFSVSPAEFHDTIARWQREHPQGMHGTSTHDSKRGEDVRARLSVLSEMPDAVGRDGRALGPAIGRLARRRPARSQPRVLPLSDAGRGLAADPRAGPRPHREGGPRSQGLHRLGQPVRPSTSARCTTSSTTSSTTPASSPRSRPSSTRCIPPTGSRACRSSC